MDRTIYVDILEMGESLVRFWESKYESFRPQQPATLCWTEDDRKNRVEPGYNDIGIYDTSSITSDNCRTNSPLLCIILYSSVITTLVYNNTKYTVPFITS
jgi:hypothetical protein